MIAIGITLSAYQIKHNTLVWKYIQMRDSYGEKAVNIKFVKAYSFEFGFEIDKFKNEDNSIRNQLLSRIESTYNSMRQVASAELMINDQYTAYVQTFNEINFCDCLSMLANQAGS